MSKNYFRLPITTASSGIHIEPFYSGLSLTPFNIEENLHNKIDVEFSEISIIDEFKNYLDEPEEFDFTNKDWVADLTREQEDWYYEAIHNLEESAFMLNSVLLPRIYDEEAANKCHLIPFKLITEDADYECVSLGGCGMDMTYKLEAYQLLADGTYDPRSNFAEKGISYFEYYYGKNSDVVKEINNLIKLSIKYEKKRA
ncbi:MAG TPA: hypothetical protein PKL04_01040 [Methanofastidiosum sp.]|nr:hypothetical protein [Methanofastidiosum sp.]